MPRSVLNNIANSLRALAAYNCIKMLRMIVSELGLQ